MSQVRQGPPDKALRAAFGIYRLYCATTKGGCPEYLLNPIFDLRQPAPTTMVSGHTGEMRLETGIIQSIVSCIRKTKGYLADETCNFDHSP